FNFGTASVGELGVALHAAVRNRTLAIPDDPVLLDELAAVKLVERVPGSFRLDHASGGHDDQAVALALAADYFQGRPVQEGRMVTIVPRGRLPLAGGLRDRWVRVGGLGSGDRIGDPPNPWRTASRLLGTVRRRRVDAAEPLPPGTVVAHGPEWLSADTVDRRLADAGLFAHDSNAELN